MGWLTSSYQLLFLQLLVLLSVSCASLCSRDQSSALLHFKQLFSFEKIPYASSYYCDYKGIHPYPKMEYWKEDSDCCSWDRVTCDMVTGHVVGLDLSCSWLHGTIPSNSSLFLLSHLQKLNLAYNEYGFSQIPPDFALFSSLKHLNLSYSNFGGQVPFAISHLSELVSLDLGDSMGFLTLENHVMRGIIQNLTKLEKLILNNVDLSTVPPGDFTNISSSLALLSLTGCGLQGSFPENIFHLPHLHTLKLSSNTKLAGSFPNVNWSSPLDHLDVSSTQFSGELPNTIGNLKSLTYLDMGSCNFIGSLPISIVNLTQLSILSLTKNKFSGYIPSSLSNLEQLTQLHLSANNFSGNIPSSLSNLEQLTFLDLSENNFCGEIPNIFTNLTQLDSLILSRNSLHGTIPSSITIGLQNLTTIMISYNSLDGTIPLELFSLPSLVQLDLSNNQLTGQIPEFQTTSLEEIDLTNNRLHGPIPNSIFELVNLTYLLLASNNLGASVELSIFGKFKNLFYLDLSYNNISVTTKNKVNFSSLEMVGLSSCNINEFLEILPSGLWSLDLSNNKIHGRFPNWLCNISTLSFLNLSHNFLTHIDRLPSVLTLDIHSNLLQGQLPAPPPGLQFFQL